MVSLFTPLFVGGLLYGLSGKRWKPQPWRWWLLVPYLPLMLDGSSHSINDMLHLGVRETNGWLATITGHAFAPTFYAGDSIGSFNWWARLISGIVAGFAFTRLVYPYLNKGFATRVYS